MAIGFADNKTDVLVVLENVLGKRERKKRKRVSERGERKTSVMSVTLPVLQPLPRRCNVLSGRAVCGGSHGSHTQQTHTTTTSTLDIATFWWQTIITLRRAGLNWCSCSASSAAAASTTSPPPSPPPTPAAIIIFALSKHLLYVLPGIVAIDSGRQKEPP